MPVIALAGKSHVGRVGVSQLTNLGLPELIAKNTDEYIELAVTLARDMPRLAKLRTTLRETMRACPLMDAPRFTRNVEREFEEMWSTYLARNQ